MKYDPIHHHNVVLNLRDGYMARFGSDLTLTNEQVFQTWDENVNVQSDDPEDREASIYEALKELQDEA